MEWIKLPILPGKCIEAYRLRNPDWASLVGGSALDKAVHKAYTRHTRWGSLASVGDMTKISHHNADSTINFSIELHVYCSLQ